MKRKMNSAAHSHAKEAILDVINKIWVDETLNCIYGIVTRDLFAPN